jgi:hypothetical protein
MSHRERLRRRLTEGGDNRSRPTTPLFAGAPPSIKLRIEELVLHGFQPTDRYGIGDALQNELTRMLTEQGMPPAMADSSQVARLDGGAFSMQPGERPSRVGSQAARAVYRGFEQIGMGNSISRFERP